ncbi:MAG TPA: sporulation protein YqfC, partial [Candidatus Deferrimicrobium sp.]|nr:sporulation protein YqfC [Candidatus Deferrimicrobium sp.]
LYLFRPSPHRFFQGGEVDMVFKKIQATLGSVLDIPKDVLLDVPKITVVGNQHVWIENHTGIVEYTPEKVRINTSLGVLVIKGKDFVLVNLLASEIRLDGEFREIKYGED